MLSRRALLAGGVSSLAAPAILARAQNSTDAAGAAPTILRLERRNIEVNGRSASVYGIRQPNGTFGIHDGGRQALPCPGRKRDRRAEPDPLARADAALAAGRRAGDFRTANSRRRQRGLRLPVALRRHVLDALASGAAGARPDDGAPHHPRRARPAGRAGGRGDAGRFQLHAGGTDLRKSEELGFDGGHGETERHGFDVEHEDGGGPSPGLTSTTSSMTPSSPISARSPTR